MHRILIFFTYLLFSLPCFAQSDESAPLIIGTKVAPPFVIKEEDGTFSGISIELWQRIAEEMGLQYEFRETTLSGLISGLQDGTLDVSVAA